eukprot:4873970-Pleurochrysis_carterae.AAC.1
MFPIMLANIRIEALALLARRRATRGVVLECKINDGRVQPRGTAAHQCAKSDRKWTWVVRKTDAADNFVRRYGMYEFIPGMMRSSSAGLRQSTDNSRCDTGTCFS